MNEDNYLTVAQAAEKLGFTHATIHRWITEEDLPHKILYQGLRPYRAVRISEIKTWLKNRQTLEK